MPSEKRPASSTKAHRPSLDEVMLKMHPGPSEQNPTLPAAEASRFKDEWRPLADVRDDPREIVAYIDLPGVDEDEISIKLTGGRLTISGDREFDHDTEDAEEFTLLQRPYGRFLISLWMPATVCANEMTAKYKRGVLKIRVPKTSTHPHPTSLP